MPRPLEDIENDRATSADSPATRNEGFAAAAEWIADDCDSETFIYRKFDDLGARNLLYLQCEILLLRKRLAAYDQRVARDDADMDLKEAARTWEVLVEQCEAGRDGALEQMSLIVELRAKIKEYRMCFRSDKCGKLVPEGRLGNTPCQMKLWSSRATSLS